MEISIDTSTEIAGIAFSSEGEVFAELTWHAGQNHTTELMPNIINLLHQSRLTIDKFNALVVAKGPGSFNGLRVGMSTAKGLAFALGMPVVSLSTLEVTAFPYAITSQPVCPILNAGRGEVAVALFQKRRGRWGRLLEEQITTVAVLTSLVKRQTIFCGEITPEMDSQLRETLGNKVLVTGGASKLRRAGYLAQLGWLKIKQGDIDDVMSLQPLYLRKPAITAPRKTTVIGVESS